MAWVGVIDDCPRFFSNFLESIEPENRNLSHFFSEVSPLVLELVDTDTLPHAIAAHLDTFLDEWLPAIIQQFVNLPSSISPPFRQLVSTFFREILPLGPWAFSRDRVRLFRSFDLILSVATPFASVSGWRHSRDRRPILDQIVNYEYLSIMATRLSAPSPAAAHFLHWILCFAEVEAFMSLPCRHYLLGIFSNTLIAFLRDSNLAGVFEEELPKILAVLTGKTGWSDDNFTPLIADEFLYMADRLFHEPRDGHRLIGAAILAQFASPQCPSDYAKRFRTCCKLGFVERTLTGHVPADVLLIASDFLPCLLDRKLIVLNRLLIFWREFTSTERADLAGIYVKCFERVRPVDLRPLLLDFKADLSVVPLVLALLGQVHPARAILTGHLHR
jgi:hypothetical protein